jgi:NAD+ kinase
MTSTAGSKTQSAVRRAAVFSRRGLEEPIQRLAAVARATGVELGDDAPDIVVVLGGDGTMLRALKQYLGTGVPVIGVNFGRFGFLTSMRAEELESGLTRAFAGEYRTIELPTLELELNGETHVAVNDVVGTSSQLGRMIEISWALGEEELGVMACDGVVCSTPSGSTAYNLSNGGPVLVWGLDAMAVTFVAPHSLHARPLVAPRGRDLAVTNVTRSVNLTVVVDGQQVGELEPGERAIVRLGEQRSLLGTLPEATFFTRYREHFAS